MAKKKARKAPSAELGKVLDTCEMKITQFVIGADATPSQVKRTIDLWGKLARLLRRIDGS